MNKKTYKQIKYGSVISYATITINIILGLIYTPWVLREVGSSNYGLFTLANSLIALFLVDFGMSAAVTRFISIYRAEGNLEGINSLIGLAIKLYSTICIIIAIILFVLYFNLDSIYTNLTIEELNTFRIVYILTGSFVVICFPVNICNGILNAYEEYLWLKGINVVNKIGTVTVTIIVLLFHGNIYELVFINGFFNLVTFIFKIIIVQKKTPISISMKTDNQISFKDFFSFSAWTTIFSISEQMMFNIIPSILAMVSNTLTITIYGFANTIEGYVYTITQAINGMFMPQVSREIVGETDANKILPLMIKVGRFNQSIVILLYTGIAVLGKEFVELWVGPEYKVLYYCIVLLSTPYLISSSQQIANTSIVVKNKIRYSALINVGSAIINIIGCILLARQYGVLGVCVSTFFAFIFRIIALNVIYVKVLRIDIASFFKECQLKMLVGSIVAFVFSYFVTKIIPSYTSGLIAWLYFIGKVLVVTVICLTSMWLLTWNESEKRLIKSFVPQIKKHDTKC